MNLFPIGDVATGSSTGTIDGLTYSMFEPNTACKSDIIFSNLNTTFDTTIVQTRKKANNTLSIKYEYDNIYTKQYRQIEAFVEKIASANLNSFYAVAWDRIITPSQIVVAAPAWTASIYDTRYFSTINYTKAYDVFVWDGTNFALGVVTTITAGTSIVIDITSGLGGLSLANGTYTNTQGLYAIYPVYIVYSSASPLANFKAGSYLPLSVDSTNEGGFMYSGDIGFTSKYTI